MRSSVLRQRLPFLLLLACVPGCFFKSSSSGITPPGTTPTNPVPAGVALYKDLDRNGMAGAGDEVHLRFNRRLTLNGATTDDLLLAVAGDSFGTAPEIQLDSSALILRAILGPDANLKGRKTFDVFDLTAGAPSAINVTSTDRILDEETGGEAAPAPFPLDIVPGFVEGLALPSGLDDRSDHVLLVDVDCDGTLDLVRTISNETIKAPTPGVAALQGKDEQSVIAILRGSPSGTFILEDVLGFEGVPTALCAGDFDNDGLLDLGLGRDGQDIVYRNSSTGPGSIAFSEAFLLDRNEHTHALIAVDSNHDGSVDLIAGDSDGVHVYRNLDGIGFDVPHTQTTGMVHDLASGDLNRDGFPDLVVARDDADSILLGSKLGYQPTVTAADNSMTHRVILVDLDRDGDLDYIAAKDGIDRVGLGEGNGFFFEQDLGDDVRDTVGLATLDVDGDGLPDLMRAVVDPDAGGNVLVMNLGQGGGAFSGTAQELPGDGAVNLACGDLDHDGDTDFAVSGNTTRLWHGSLSGIWGAFEPMTRTDLDLGAGAAEVITSADFTGDGLLDLAIGGAEHFTLYTGQSDGSFGAPLIFAMPATRTQDIAFADLDMDGDLDMLVASLGGPVTLWLNDGSGGFTDASGLIPNITNAMAIALGDLTASGFPDIVLGRSRGHQDALLLNTGAAPSIALLGDKGPGDKVAPCTWLGFVAATTSFSVEHTRDIAVGDLDCDGDLDLVFAHQNLISDVVWLNSGSGFFQDVAQTLSTNYSRDLALADLDGDGLLDLAVGSFDSDQIWAGQGDGHFALVHVFDAADTQACDIADVNGDGRLDLMTAGAYGAQVRYGQALGGFLEQPDHLHPELQVQDLHLAELAHDGTLQILLAAKIEKVAHQVLASR